MRTPTPFSVLFLDPDYVAAHLLHSCATKIKHLTALEKTNNFPTISKSLAKKNVLFH